MAQVNIDVAKEASVQSVNTKVGTSSDTASSTPTTLFAGIKGLIAWFTGVWTATRAGYVDTINANTATNNTASKTGSLSQKESYSISLLENGTFGLSAIKSTLASVGGIKSVQRGSSLFQYTSSSTPTYANCPKENDIPYIDINISTVNSSKTFGLFSQPTHGLSSGVSASGKLINSTTLRLYATYELNGSAKIYVNWQVIEFN